MDSQDFININRELWNQKTKIHTKSSFYDVEGFITGKTSLQQIELDEVGDVRGKTLLHLQCHFGMDTLSWARLGADVVGVDFSDQAIEYAKQLTEQLQLHANFVCSNVYDLKQNLQQTFDIVFTSYGVIGWLPDLQKWAEIISHFLKPGGTFYMVEFHPVVWMFDNDFSRIEYSYHNTTPIIEELEGTYADRNAPVKHKSYSWNHSLSEVINALIQQGLIIEQFNEFDYSSYDCFQQTIQGEDGQYRIRGLEHKIPMMYSLKARKN